MTDKNDWKDLPALPEALAGQCVGISGDWLIVAGGSLWNKPPWDGGIKQWSDRVYGLRSGATSWKLLGHLPQSMAYGASAQWNQSLLCAGGQNANEVFDHVLKIELDAQGKLRIDRLLSLPVPLTNAAAVVANGELLLIGGQHSIQPGSIAKDGLRLNIEGESSWRTFPLPWQHQRILPVAAACHGTIYVAGGADLSVAKDGTPVRTYLRDAWSYDLTTHTWTALPELPAAVTAAPSACSSLSAWLIFGGDDGALAPRVQQLRDAHPGFRKDVLRYDVAAKQWNKVSHLPLSLVTTGAAIWNHHVILAGGENQPGHRSSRVVQLPLSSIQ